jgi:hypothetical protein
VRLWEFEPYYFNNYRWWRLYRKNHFTDSVLQKFSSSKAWLSNQQSKKKTSTKPTVISFRISGTQERLLTEIQKRDQAAGVNSTRQLCRKIVVDYLAGRLTYKNPKDKDADLEKYPRKD